MGDSSPRFLRVSVCVHLQQQNPRLDKAIGRTGSFGCKRSIMFCVLFRQNYSLKVEKLLRTITSLFSH